jgi:hypothetical protein
MNNEFENIFNTKSNRNSNKIVDLFTVIGFGTVTYGLVSAYHSITNWAVPYRTEQEMCRNQVSKLFPNDPQNLLAALQICQGTKIYVQPSSLNKDVTDRHDDHKVSN